MKKPPNSYFIKRKFGTVAGGLVLFFLVTGICYLLIFPLLYLFIASVQDPQSMMDSTVIWVPKELSGVSYVNALEQLDYTKSFIFSFFLSVVSMLLTVISCSMVGYGFSRFDFFEKKIAFVLVVLIIIVPPQTTMMSTYLNFRFFDIFGLFKLFGAEPVNLLGSPLTMFLPALFAGGIRSGLAIFIFRQFFLGQPKELEEAAKIDGCGIFGTYVKVMMPLSVPAIITVLVFSFVWYWNDTFYSGLFFTGNNQPLAVQLSDLRAMILADTGGQIFTPQEQKGVLAAAALLCVTPPLIFYMFIQNKFVESIERTGIVG